MQVWGYVPDSDRDAAWATVAAHRSLLTGVSLFQYRLEDGGGIVEYLGLGGVPAWAASGGLPVVPMVTNLVGEGWDRDLVARMLLRAEVRSQHIDALLRLAVDGAHPGIELDYENLAVEDREPFASFAHELSQALHGRGKELSMALHAKTAEPGDSPGAQAQDWAALGRAADRLVIMTYDHDPSRPGPIAPLAWSQAVLEFALSQIPPTKVIQGIPFYGYDWSADGARAYRTYEELQQLAAEAGVAPQREELDAHLVVRYARDGVAHEVWIPDRVTVEKLMAVGQRLRVAGFASWRMGGEDPGAWDVIARLAGSA